MYDGRTFLSDATTAKFVGGENEIELLDDDTSRAPRLLRFKLLPTLEVEDTEDINDVAICIFSDWATLCSVGDGANGNSLAEGRAENDSLRLADEVARTSGECIVSGTYKTSFILMLTCFLAVGGPPLPRELCLCNKGGGLDDSME